MNGESKDPTYNEKVWEKTEAGEWSYIGPDELVLNFEPPLALSDKDTNPINSITLKEPTAQHMSAFLKAQRTEDDVEAGIRYIAANTGFTPPHLRKMRTREFQKAMEFLAGFTPPDQMPKA